MDPDTASRRQELILARDLQNEAVGDWTSPSVDVSDSVPPTDFQTMLSVDLQVSDWTYKCSAQDNL